MSRIQIGVSQCLLGAEVRFDAGHKRDRYVVEVLGDYFEYVPVCPEVGVGMSVPRPPIRLVQVGDRVRVLGVRDPTLDVTDALDGYYDTVRDRFDAVRGFILKRASPSCGMERVKIYDERGVTQAHGAGAFARALMADRPNLPVEEEGRLNDPVLRENFLTRVFAYDRWRALRASGPSVADLQGFHGAHKLLLMAHNQAAYRRLGQRVAASTPTNLAETLHTYEAEFMAALTRKADPGRHANVLQHLLGYLKRDLDAGDRAEMVEVIDRYRRRELPLVVPITLLRHHFRRHPNDYVARQIYLTPHPDELMLRNRV